MNLAPEIFYGIGALFIAAAIAYGFFQNARRNRSNDQITEAATHELYEHSQSEYENEIRPELEKEVRK